MNRLRAGSLMLLLLTCGWGAHSVGQEVRTPHGELRIVDKQIDSQFSIDHARIEPLLDIDVDGRIVPLLARSWHWRDDRTLVLSLRQGVAFQNGEVFDAEHVKEAWEKKKEVHARWKQAGKGMVSSIAFAPEARLEIRDPSTVQIVLPAPDVQVLLKLRRFLIPNRQFWRTLDVRAQEAGKPRAQLYPRTLRSPGPWGTGPYTLLAGAANLFSRSDQIVLEAHRNYWNKDHFPQVQRIVLDYTLAINEALERLKTSEGQVDIVTRIPPLDTLRVAQSPFGAVVKERSTLQSIFGMFNMRKAGSPWHDVRLRQAANYAINRAHVLRYATKGNGVLIPALLTPAMFGYDATLAPYPFAPDTARRLLREAGYAEGRVLSLIAPEKLRVQATVVGKMLEHVGFTVQLQILDTRKDFTRSINLMWFLGPKIRGLKPRPWPTWDIALVEYGGGATIFSSYLPTSFYNSFILDDSWADWVSEQPAMRQLHAQVLRTTDRAQQRTLIQQIEHHIHEQAYFLFLYAPLQTHAVNKDVKFKSRADALLDFVDFAVTENHWSVRPESSVERK